MKEATSEGRPDDEPQANRRSFLSVSSSVAMAGGLLAGYGTLAAIAGHFLYPARAQERVWLFVVEASKMQPGDTLNYQTPAGQIVTISRQGNTGTAEDFLALSTTCPHLGCKVHWEEQRSQFVCPCHNGVFDNVGKAIAGPPADAQQSLPRYPLRIENELIFIEVPAAASV